MSSQVRMRAFTFPPNCRGQLRTRNFAFLVTHSTPRPRPQQRPKLARAHLPSPQLGPLPSASGPSQIYKRDPAPPPTSQIHMRTKPVLSYAQPSLLRFLYILA